MLGARAAALVAVALTGTGALAAASPRPDLVETAVSFSERGALLRISDSVENQGAVLAPRSTTRFYLGRLRIDARSVGRLRPGARSRGSETLRIPSELPVGSYRLLACADARRRVRESNERNNCLAARGSVEVTDRTPPQFAGLQRATTCIPGPVSEQVRYSHYSLRWDPASDAVTPSDQLVYTVYQATGPGGEDFSRPTYTTPPGATSFTTPLLPDHRAYYFVVRVKDQAGNQDRNSVERVAVNLCV